MAALKVVYRPLPQTTPSRPFVQQARRWTVLHVAIDGATRLAYVEVLPDETRRSTTRFLIRALRWFKAQGVKVEPVMTENVLCQEIRVAQVSRSWGIRCPGYLRAFAQTGSAVKK